MISSILIRSNGGQVRMDPTVDQCCGVKPHLLVIGFLNSALQMICFCHSPKSLSNSKNCHILGQFLAGG